MKSRFLFVALLVLLETFVADCQTITWSGDGDATSWSDPQNWTGDQVPEATNAVAITSGAGTNVVISSSVSILNILCSRPLTVSSGSLTVTAGASALQSSFAMVGGTTLTATGTNTTFTANGPTAIDSVNLNVSDGADMTLSNAENVSLGCGITWTVTGSNSVLNFPALTNLSSGGFECVAGIQALAGGHFNATNLLVLSESTGFDSGVTVTADGTNSLIGLNSLQSCSVGPVTFQVSDGGTILASNLLGGPNVGVTLNPDSSLVASNLQVLGNITANGVTVKFPMLTNFNGGSFSINSGAVVTLPALQSVTLGCANSWTVDGAGSVLNLPGLTNMTGGGFECLWTIQALAGGQLIATNLAGLEEEAGPASLTIIADGANSLIDFSGLETSSGGATITFQASNGGTVRLTNLVSGPNISLVLEENGTVLTPKVQQLGGITASGVTASFPSLSDFDGGTFTINSGATVTLPALENVNLGCDITWTVTGGTLNLPALTNITASGFECNWTIQALAGGQLIANNLASLEVANNPASALTVVAEGTNSLIDFAGLQVSSGGGPITFEASSGGTVELPGLVGGANISVILNDNGTLVANQAQQLGGITASNVTATFPSLTNFDGGSFNVSGSADLTLPALTSFNLGCGQDWTVTGTNSVLNLPGLTNLTGGGFECSATIQALMGGQLAATNLVNVEITNAPDSSLTVIADGTNSLIDFSGLQTVSGAPVSFEASDDGTVNLSKLVGGPNITLILNDNGTLLANQAQQLGGITASNVTASFLSLSNFDGGSFNISGGASVTLPVLQQVSVGCGQNWTVTGTNSVLDLPAMTNLTGGGFECSAAIQALMGGQLMATNLSGIEEDAGGSGSELTVIADGTNSLINFSGLLNSSGTGTVTFQAGEGGTVNLSKLVGGPNVDLTYNPNATLLAGSVQELAGITASNSSVTLPSLTNFNGGSLNISDGATVTLPALGYYSCMNNGPAWEVAGVGSSLNLPGLTNLLGSFCCALDVGALAGGQVLLNNLSSVQNGNASFLADGTGSLINLSQLSYFTSSIGGGQITATNGGVVLFSSQVFLLENVAVDISGENLSASPGLTLYGMPWHSYQVETRNTQVPNSPWVFLALVPLTNAFETFAGAQPANTAFLITDFVATQPLLQISLAPSNQVQLTLYGETNGVYQIQSTTNLVPTNTWASGVTITMTNAFRILPPAQAVGTQFYRAKDF